MILHYATPRAPFPLPPLRGGKGVVRSLHSAESCIPPSKLVGAAVTQSEIARPIPFSGGRLTEEWTKSVAARYNDESMSEVEIQSIKDKLNFSLESH